MGNSTIKPAFFSIMFILTSLLSVAQEMITENKVSSNTLDEITLKSLLLKTTQYFLKIKTICVKQHDSVKVIWTSLKIKLEKPFVPSKILVILDGGNFTMPLNYLHF